MITNIEKYKKDFEKLNNLGIDLYYAMQYKCYPKDVEEALKKSKKDKAKDFINKLPRFEQDYQTWYSECLSLLNQLLPLRVNDFIRLYEKPKNRKDITYENYTIEDYLQGLRVTIGYQKDIVVDQKAAIPRFEQQRAILESLAARFESSLYDIQQLVQADLFDDELKAALELNKHKYYRASGALAGVVLEKHLKEICSRHEIKFTKKTPTLFDYYEGLKTKEVIDIPTWRFIQHLSDIRNLCDHSKDVEPKVEQITDLIEGTKKIIKTVF